MSGVGEARTQEIAGRVERFVRDVVAPYERDPRRDHHDCPTDAMVDEMREKARAAGRAPVARGEGENILKRAYAGSFRPAQRLGRRRRLAKVAHGRKHGAEVEDTVFPDRSH